jgi:glycosyltransferase involved in cell wall biosynthesis
MKINMSKSSPVTKSIRVLVVQQINRAYRVPLLKRLSQQADIELTMVCGTSPPVQAGDVGITIATDPMPFRTISGPISGLRWKGREILWFDLSLQLIKREFFDVVISDYYTRLLSIWPMQTIQHRRNAGFILWGIGFHQYPTPLLDKIRLLMIKRTDALLLYSEKESRRYQEMGVPQEKCFVIQNTVDIEGIDAGVAMATNARIQECRQEVGSEKGPLLMHIGRLAKNKRLDLLLRALPNLRKKWAKITLVLIGEGPEMEALQKLAHELSISGIVHFLGSITDHKLLAPWVIASDLIVAPAQIGLLAPMSHAYGKTLVISDVPEHHFPEVQACIPGQTCMKYKYEDVDNLASVIDGLLANPEKCRMFAKAGSARVRELMGPEQMLDAFLAAIRYVHNTRCSRYP